MKLPIANPEVLVPSDSKFSNTACITVGSVAALTTLYFLYKKTAIPKVNKTLTDTNNSFNLKNLAIQNGSGLNINVHRHDANETSLFLILSERLEHLKILIENFEKIQAKSSQDFTETLEKIKSDMIQLQIEIKKIEKIEQNLGFINENIATLGTGIQSLNMIMQENHQNTRQDIKFIKITQNIMLSITVLMCIGGSVSISPSLRSKIFTKN